MLTYKIKINYTSYDQLKTIVGGRSVEGKIPFVPIPPVYKLRL